MTRPRGRRVVNLRILPSSMSVLAICAGLTSIRFALEGQPHVAIALIAAAAILDGLDGRVARALDAESRMGEEIDSLADAVNFGAGWWTSPWFVCTWLVACSMLLVSRIPMRKMHAVSVPPNLAALLLAGL